MKSDEEFIAGIYKKAENQKIEEEKAAQNLQRGARGRYFRLGRALAAAACLSLIVSAAVYAGSRSKQPEKDPSVQQNGVTGEDAVMALSLSEPGMPAAEEDAAQDGNASPRGRIAAGEDFEAQPEENVIAGGLQTGLLIAYPPGYQNPAGEEGVKRQEDHTDIGGK